LISACHYIFNRMPEQQHSNILCSILSSMDGAFGYTAVNVKTELNPIWVSALTSIYWFFDLDRVSRLKLFYGAALKTGTVQGMAECINDFRNKRPAGRPGIPL